jgi:3-deoxy-D-manno-octulosonic-acid transferase
VALVNARMSEKSLRSAMRWATLMQPTYGALSAVWAQTESDAERLQALSAQVQAVTGNLKFDAQPDAAQSSQAQGWRTAVQRPVVMLASSREGEEAQWLAAVQAVPDALRAVHWLIVPRHPQRVDDVARLFTEAGLSVSRRSSWGPEGPQGDALQADVWLGDSLGEMALYYSLSDLALLGGSYEALGGQNLIEAAACACPVLMGPHTFNFAEVAERAEAEGAARRVQDMAQAVQQALEAVADPAFMPAWRTQALAFSQAHKGAAQRVAGLVKDLLGL